jgi:hypothetical protein
MRVVDSAGAAFGGTSGRGGGSVGGGAEEHGGARSVCGPHRLLASENIPADSRSGNGSSPARA